jgi:pimeloyl-ACP methyl ester carboxylesterase
MTERVADIGGVEICFETFGDPADRPLLLIRGVYGQMIWWFEELCEQIASHGFHVIRFDNRDSGRSRPFAEPPRLVRATLGLARPPYGLTDLAADAFGLLDHLGIRQAHVMGLSMGGMIAQTMAIEQPDRILSLTSIMSTTGSPRVGLPSRPLGLRYLTQRFPEDPGAFVERSMAMLRAQAGRGFPFDESALRGVVLRSVERGISTRGPQRQMAALLAAPDRTAGLKTLSVPALVVHGTADTVIGISGGRATAKAIAGSHLMVIEGMGHDLPRGMWDQLVDGVLRTVARAEYSGADRGDQDG